MEKPAIRAVKILTVFSDLNYGSIVVVSSASNEMNHGSGLACSCCFVRWMDTGDRLKSVEIYEVVTVEFIL